jgi:hypothetical protein
MDSIALGVMVALLTGALWVAGAVLQWSNIRRQERLVARLWRLSVRRKRKGPADAAPVLAQAPPESLQPANRWTVG